VAVKESTGNLEQMTRIKALCGPDFDLISGDDPIVLPVLSIGGVGVISVTSNLIPGETSRMVHRYLEGKIEESRELFYKYYDLIKTILSIDVNPVGIKTVMALRGQVSEEFRLPLVPLTPESKEVLRKELEKYNLLSVKAAAGSSR
jgi:4-hydroxy-tetrahydrodipicolinate synthase